jgi:enterochelin esterase-like enzyme
LSQDIKDNRGHIRPASQVQVVFSITLPPNTPSDEEVYLAADFGNWRTDSPAYKFERSGNLARLSLWLPSNLNFRYKYTRGSWFTVEVAANGAQLPNRWGVATHNRVFHDNIANWQDRMVKIPRIDQRVERVTINSKILKVPKSFYIYLPPDYDEPYQRNERYPVLYLFRGHEREWVNAEEDHSREGRTIIDTYLEALEKGLVGRMILVFPGISSDEDTIPGLLVNFKDPKLAGGAHGIGTGRFEDYFLEELMPYIDNRYRTLSDGAHRGVAGFSLGGLTAIKIAAQYPRLFNSASAYDGTFFYSTRSGKSIKQDDRIFAAPLFNPHFGVPRDYAYGAANNPANLIIRGESAALDRICWMIQSGPESAEPGDANYYRAQHLIKALAGHNIKNALPPVIEDGRHNWHTADRHLSYALPLHWKQLRPGQ